MIALEVGFQRDVAMLQKLYHHQFCDFGHQSKKIQHLQMDKKLTLCIKGVPYLQVAADPRNLKYSVLNGIDYSMLRIVPYTIV